MSIEPENPDIEPLDAGMLHATRWIIAQPSAQATELAGRLKTSTVLAQVLLNRGISEPADAMAFLSPSPRDLHDPSLLPGMDRAAARLAAAIRDRQKIVIYGDYDVDGITATSILWHAIHLLGGQVDHYIPHRIEEGYGMNPDAVRQICAEGAQLIVSVDCGITAVEEARICASAGVDLIVTDHHEWHTQPVVGAQPVAQTFLSLPDEVGSQQSAVGGAGAPEVVSAHEDPIQNPKSEIQNPQSPLLPDCHAIVHPRLPGTDKPYPNPYLCGAGVAFKLAWAVGQQLAGGPRVSAEFRQFLVEAASLAALGTIADVVPLRGENRALAAFGLSGLKASGLTGIRALIASAGLTGKNLDSYDVGFLLAPRLNACGRMGHAREAVEMLTRANEPRAMEIATYLEQQNRTRQNIERSIFEQALQQCEQLGYRADDPDCRAIVLAAEGWHPGVIGIVASRIVGKFHRPTIMVALTNGHGQGSGRSIAGFHLARALEACRQHLQACGGHEMAAGLSLESARLDDFRAAFAEYAQRALSPESLKPELRIDCEASLAQITMPLVKDLRRLEPFGQGNPRPLLCCREVEVAAPPRRVGRTGDHLQLIVRQAGGSMKCIAFGAGAMAERLRPGTRVDLAVQPQLNTFNDITRVELEVKQLRIIEDAA